jgi:3-hydroxy-9,10-secoandrosta-1,3,5(10)-triene-9,17-dione monooxygenase reductase component
MAVTSQEYRDALSKFASGVTIVTVTAGGRPHGMTASAFAAVSLEPPLVLVCLEKTSRTRALVLETGIFAVSILVEDQQEIAKAFSRPGKKPFDELSHRAGKNGSPLLDGAIACVECTVESVVGGGDHDVVIGEVTACEPRGGQPLVYFNRGYRSLG